MLWHETGADKNSYKVVPLDIVYYNARITLQELMNGDDSRRELAELGIDDNTLRDLPEVEVDVLQMLGQPEPDLVIGYTGEITKIIREMIAKGGSQTVLVSFERIEDPNLKKAVNFIAPNSEVLENLFAEETESTEKGEQKSPRSIVTKILTQILISEYRERKNDFYSDNQYSFGYEVASYFNWNSESKDQYLSKVIKKRGWETWEYMLAHTEAELVEKKGADIEEEASKRLRHSLQVISYNEMPGTETIETRGKLADFLMSTFIVGEEYYKRSTKKNGDTDQKDQKDQEGEKDGKGDIEVLININNEKGNIPLGNERSIQFIKALKSSKSADGFIANLGWDIAENKGIENFYRRLFEKYHAIADLGFSLQVVDCTDGAFIAAEHDGDIFIERSGF